MDYNLSFATKILNILRYGIIFENKLYKVYSLSYDEYCKDYIFLIDDDAFFFLSDLDNIYKANIGNGY